MNFDSTNRFSDRVRNYVKYRPSYPVTLIQFLVSTAGLGAQTKIADLGSGTGIFTKLLLETGAQVYGVEPNAPMREAAGQYLAKYKNFVSIEGTGEETHLAEASVSLITIAQAFHWFDHVKCREEFRRILKKPGWLAIIWNTARTDTPFGIEFDRLKVKYGGEDLKNITTHAQDEKSHIAYVYDKSSYNRTTFDNFQELDLNGLIGRFFSASYAPKSGAPEYPSAEKDLIASFAQFQKNGTVRIDYETEVYLGQI